MASVSHRGPIHLGLDVHKDPISVAILAPDHDGPDVERIAHDEASVRRLVGRFPDPRLLRAGYEAGPTGYELARLHRAGELVAARISTVAEEAVRELCRARADMVQDRTRARHRLGKFWLRHGRPWRGGKPGP